MDQPTQSDQPFYIGLCMAGAVSAGAYTAGVIDYLLEALQEWEKRRGEAGVPTHRVEIPVIGGASAGGMTGIIASAALQQQLTPLDKPTPGAILAEHPENVLYHSWVDLVDKNMFPLMLENSDIESAGDVVSALNSDFIDKIAQRVIKPSKPAWKDLPPFINPKLKVFVTLSNLEGFCYDINFKANGPDERHPYYMLMHNDYACFELADKSNIAPTPGWIPLDLKNGLNSSIAVEAAMATGAFPVGLKSRVVKRDSNDVNHNPWLKDILSINPVPAGDYTTLNVDGGLINNEPFDRVRDVLTTITGQTNKSDYQSYSRFKSTVLMVAPFPSVKPAPINIVQKLLNVMGLTLSAMISQMRSKPIHLVEAMDDDCAGQYLIDPARLRPDKNGVVEEVHGEKAIACGALGGFSGFLNKEFRVHDYFLGRYNCKIFLRDYFTLSERSLEKNEIFKNGYANADIDKHRSKKDGSIQIIPVFDDVDYTFPDFKFSSGSNWPAITQADIDVFRKPLRGRADALIMNIKKFGMWTKALIWVGVKVVLGGLLADAVITGITNSLDEWELIRKKND